MPKKTVDLDAFLAEQEANGTEIKFRGKIYSVPPEIPWAAFAKAQQMQGEEVSIEQIGDVVSIVIGRESWDQMVAEGIGFRTGMMVLNTIMDLFGDSMPEGEEDPKVKAAQDRIRQASAWGSKTLPASSDSSRPTSGGTITLAQAN